MVKQYDIDFFRHDVANVKTLYIEVGEDSLRTLSFGETSVSTPHRGAIFSTQDSQNMQPVSDLLNKYPDLTSIYAIVNTPSFAIVPQSFFDVEQKESYLTALDENFDENTDTTYCDFLKEDDAYLIYKIPKLLNEFIQKAPYFNCYHLHTGIRYITRKKSFAKFQTHIVTFFDHSGRMYMLAFTGQKLIFAQSYILESPSDAHYYIEFCLQTFFPNLREKIQLLIFAPMAHDVQSLIRHYRAKSEQFYVQLFSLDDIFRIYGVTNPPFMAEDFFLSLLLSLCES